MSRSRSAADRAHLVGPVVAGLLVVLVAYSGPVLVIRLAATNAGLSPAQLDSWLFAVSAGSGVAGLVLSLWTRQPIIVAFSSAGAVLLTTSLVEYRFAEAIGAYIAVAGACMVIGVTGTFSRILARIPQAIVAAMLAGTLFSFGTGYFAALPGRPARWRITALVALMGVIYFVARSRGSRLAVVWTSAGGLVVAVVLRLTTSGAARVSFAHLTAHAPSFSLGAMTGLALPLLALSLSSQYAPGYAVLQASGYEPPMDRILVVTGVVGLAGAPFGGPGVNLAAITAGLATGPHAHPDRDRRYLAGVATGVTYIVAGLCGASLLSVFSIVPQEFVAAVTGLALFGTIAGSAATALADPMSRDAGAATMLCAAGGFTLFHVGAPFWALVVGLAVDVLHRRAR